MSERLPSGLLDTSVVIDLGLVDPELLPLTVGVRAITMAELAAGRCIGCGGVVEFRFNV